MPTAETRPFLLLFGPGNQAILKVWRAVLKIISHLPQLSAALLDRQSIKQQVKQLQDHFIRLAYCTYEELVDKGVSVHNVHAWLISLDVFRQREHQDFIKDNLTNIEKGTHLSNLWARLGTYWNFLNFDLLKHVIKKFGSENLKQKMKSYKCDLQSFRRVTRVCDFIDCWPVQGEAPEADLREFVTKMKHDWNNCTLEDLDKIKGVITCKFFIPKFALWLRDIKEGCITIVWLIPVSLVKALQEAIEGTSSEFFMEHKIETITIDGQECYPTTTRNLVEYSEKQLTSESVAKPEPEIQQSEDPSVGVVSKKLHSFKSRASEEQASQKETHRMRLAEEILSGESTSMVPSEKIQFDTQPGETMRETESSSFLSKLKQKLGIQQQTISRHVKLLPSPEQYLSKTEVEADPSLPVKYKDYLSSTPAIRAALYTTFNAKTAAEVFTWSQHTESPPPTTMTELFTAFTIKTLVDHLSTHPVHHKQQLKVTTFSDLPTDVYKQFQDLCRMAYEGILNRQQLVFSAAHLPTGFAPLGLMQEVPQLYTEDRASSYHFTHLTLQEYLAAVHISQLLAHEQTRLFRKYVDSGHFKMTMRFLAGCTKLANIPPVITMDTKLNYFHFLFEAKDISMTTRTLGSDKMFVMPHYYWTPLDYYVTGHAISHSNCSWTLYFTRSNDDEFELFFQGCAAPGGTGYRGHISYADFSSNGLTSKSIQSFVNIPPHILQYLRELELSYNKLDGSACDLLAKAIPSMSRLEKLWLGDNPIGSGGAVEMIKALCGSGVKQLRLWDTVIGEPDCEALCELLKSTHSLQHLHIDQNNLSSESVASIMTGLSHNSSLTHLVISNSHFSMANVDSLASIFKDHSKCTLTWLWLQDCHISSEGAVELAAALCKNSTLKCLYLDRNSIGVEGASSMSDMLQHNTSLEVLHLREDSVGEEGVRQLINSLKHNQTLRELGLPRKYTSVTSDHRITWWW